MQGTKRLLGRSQALSQRPSATEKKESAKERNEQLYKESVSSLGQNNGKEGENLKNKMNKREKKEISIRSQEEGGINVIGEGFPKKKDFYSRRGDGIV